MQGIRALLTANMDGMLEKRIGEVNSPAGIYTTSVIIVISLAIHILSLKMGTNVEISEKIQALVNTTDVIQVIQWFLENTTVSTDKIEG